MRKLFLMLGAPASGKDYWIKQHHLQEYAITPDVLRTQFSTPKFSINEDNQAVTAQLGNKAEADVWSAVRTAVYDHMKHGCFAVVNATNLFKGAFRNYNADRITYHYKVYVIDTMRQWYDQCNGNRDQLISRLVMNDHERSARKQVGEKVIAKYVDRYLNLIDKTGKVNVPNGIHYVDSRDEDTISSLLDWQTTDMSKFKRIKIIGDVHGDYDALSKVFDDHVKGDAYIFVGDYLDRGTKSPEVFKFITQDLGGDNLFFIKGNHETGWEKWQTKGKLSGQFSYDSLPRLQAIYDEDELKKIINRFAKNWLTYVKFKFGDKTYFVSHAGIEPFMTELQGETLDDGLFVEGIGPNNDPYNRDIDLIWNNAMPKDMINVHGHRNVFDHFKLGNSYNLTKDGKFRWLVIDSEGIHTHEIDRIDTRSFAQQLINEDHVRQQPLTDGIIANNFDRQAFRKDIWNDMTLRARGLFTRGNDIVGRGFNKFFQIDQFPTETLDSLSYPVVVEKKWNGFLAVTFWDKKENFLRIYSKGGGETFSNLARKDLSALGWDNYLLDYYSSEANQNTTVLFEIIDPVNDPHIVKYDNLSAKPLAIIDNDKEGLVDNLFASDKEKESWDEKRLAMVNAIEKATFFAYAENKAQLEDIINRFETQHPLDEGLVLYSRAKMLKYKSKFYLKAKELRLALERQASGFKKKRWYYGAEPWFKWCQEHDETRFSPTLALNLYNLDKENKL